MAGHSQFANIKHRKNAQDAKKAKIFTKLAREIITAVKLGGADPEGNSRLRTAILAARASNVPKDKIEGAIKRASSSNEGDNFEEMRYEGYGPAGVAFIVDALTDNRNRTASEVRNAFTKHNGSLGETGSVSFVFERVGMLEFADLNVGEEQFFEEAIEAGANDIEVFENKFLAYTDAENLGSARELLVQKYGEPQVARLTWNPKTFTDIDDIEVAEKILKFIDALEDSDDVQFVTGNYRFSDKIIDALK
jgi:YebC/PmpR family DNA-binding regulatory protein